MLNSLNLSEKIRNIIIFSNRLMVFKRMFILIGKLQLSIISFLFMLHRDISGVILRRKNVIYDFYPGNSDFDITCIISAGREDIMPVISYYAKVHRILKAMFFPIGETKLICEEDFENHIRYVSVNYYDYPGDVYFTFVKKNKPIVLKTKTSETICVYQKIWQIFFIYVWNPLAGVLSCDKSVFSRNLCKNQLKIKFLISRINKQENIINLDYNRLPYRDKNFMLSIEERRDMINSCEKIITENLKTSKFTDDFIFEIKGYQALMDYKSLEILHGGISQSVDVYRDLLEGVFIFNHRLYNASKVIALKFKDMTKPENKKELWKLVENHADTFKNLDLHPVLIQASMWDKYFSIERMSNVLFHNSHYDFLSKKMSYGKAQDVSINKRFIYTDLVESMDLMLSYVRNKDAVYLLDLIFGHITAYNIILSKSILYASFDSLYKDITSKYSFNNIQKEIIMIYLRNDQARLKEMDGLNVWQLFEKLIKSEMNASRMLLKSS